MSTPVITVGGSGRPQGGPAGKPPVCNTMESQLRRSQGNLCITVQHCTSHDIQKEGNLLVQRNHYNTLLIIEEQLDPVTGLEALGDGVK